jgi:hypothetical protein
MELIIDILLVAGSLSAGFYCLILGRRLHRFNDLRDGVGGAVAILSAQVDDLTKSLHAAQQSSLKSSEMLTDLVIRAENAARKLELTMASLHDFEPDQGAIATPSAESGGITKPSTPMFVRRRETGATA